MTTLVVVRKNNTLAIAGDSQSTFGDTRLGASYDCAYNKIFAIGDAYMVAAGVPEHRPDHATALAAMGLDMIAATQEVAHHTGLPITIRAGMASGPMMAGVIGKRKFSYDVWGDPVNLASRLEQASQPGRILLCPSCKAALERDFLLEQHDTIDIKGVGPQDTWFLNGRRREAERLSPSNAVRTAG